MPAFKLKDFPQLLRRLFEDNRRMGVYQIFSCHAVGFGVIVNFDLQISMGCESNYRSQCLEVWLT